MVESQAESKPSHKVDALNLSNLGSRRDTKLLNFELEASKHHCFAMYPNTSYCRVGELLSNIDSLLSYLPKFD